jgi:phosphoribosyl-ATP pyrophosphohydrolase
MQDVFMSKNRVSLKPGKRPRYGYHTVHIEKGVLGEISKIQEELDELKDAEKQGVKILIACELADLYGAIRVYALKYGLKMGDLHDMAKLTRNAFEQGSR